VWEKKKLLVWGKTYPEFSKKYYETVCSGAVDADTGKLVRIYPITLRYKEDQFSTYDWIEAEIERNTSDFRPESFKIQQNAIRKVGRIDAGKSWPERTKWVLRPSNVFPSVEALQHAEARDHTSLGLVKPKQIVDVVMKWRPESEREEWEHHRQEALRQKDLFVDAEKTTARDLQYVPVKYHVKFVCDATNCTGHDLSILDWGTYNLHRRMIAQRGPAEGERAVINAIRENLDLSKRDAFLFLGNTKAHPHNFMIVGILSPPHEKPAKQPLLPGI